ncbi:MAG: DUF302 domain-containing protein [Brevinema sp.]
MKILGLLILLISTSTFGQEVIKKELSISVDQAVTLLKKNIKEKKLMIFAEINHQKAAESVRLTMPKSYVIIFGNPAVGTLLMNDNILWSYELPLKIAIYADKNGNVWAQSRTLVKDIQTSKNNVEIMNKMNMLLKSLVDSIE